MADKTNFENLFLGWTDYGMLILFLGLSTTIGIWYGFFAKRRNSLEDFLIAGGRMHMLPVAMSLLASVVSPATLLGVPTEIYNYGTMYIYRVPAWLVASYLTGHVFMPKFREFNCVSIYAYIEKRFSLSLRIAVTSIFIITSMLYMSVILYGPSLALSQVTGLQVWIAIISCGLVCTFYTSIGGMKAVIWTDVAQTFFIFIGIILSIIFGLIDVGGFKQVYRIALAGQRIDLSSISLDPTVRYTIWSILISDTLQGLTVLSFMQTQVQRFMCVKSTRDAIKTNWISYILFSFMMILCTIAGLLIYTKYYSCDPIKAKLIAKSDQLYPLFVIQTIGKIPGLTGLFIASIMSASMSTISSGVNSVAAVILEDIYKRILPNAILSEKRQAYISKYISLVLGVFIVILAFIMSHLTNIVTIVISTFGTLASPICGLFILGFFFPRVKSRSIWFALCIVLAFQLWILVGATLTASKQQKKSLSTSVAGCPFLNKTNIISTPLIGSNENNTLTNLFLPLYSISFMWYTFNGVTLMLILGLAHSLICDRSAPDDSVTDSLLFIKPSQILCCHTMNKTEEENIETMVNAFEPNKIETKKEMSMMVGTTEESQFMLKPLDF